MDLSLSWLLEIPGGSSELTGFAVVIRLLSATLVGGAIGWERGNHGRAAGLRTHIVVCLGACLASMIGIYTSQTFQFGGDPNRIAAQVVSGIGFLGVGTIIIGQSSQVTGLTTAAGLWTTAIVGLALGSGFYWASFLATLIIIATMTALAQLERRIRVKRVREQAYIELKDVKDIQALLSDMDRWEKSIEICPPRSGYSNHVGVEVTFPSYIPQDFLDVMSKKNYVEFII